MKDWEQLLLIIGFKILFIFWTVTAILDPTVEGKAIYGWFAILSFIAYLAGVIDYLKNEPNERKKARR